MQLQTSTAKLEFSNSVQVFSQKSDWHNLGIALEIKQLRTFLAIASTGSVTRAAEMLHIVQPALSRQLRMLEEDLGTPLFERIGHGMQLTPAGQLFVKRAQRAITEMDQAKNEIIAAPKSISGVVTVGLLPSVCDLLAGPLVQHLKGLYPELSVRLLVGYVGYLQDWLERGELDMALLYSHKSSPALEITPLLVEKLYLIGSPKENLDLTKPVPLHDLRDMQFVMPAHPHGLRTLLEQAFSVAGIDMRIASETNSMATQKSLVAHGLGFTVLPGAAVFDDIKHKRLTAAPICDPEINRKIVFATSMAKNASLAVRCVAKAMRMQIAHAVGSDAWPGATLIDKN